MRLLAALALIVSMSAGEIERAQALARARESERRQFHSRYVFNLQDPVVSQIEVVTEFRRLVIIAEDHVLRGDWMFTRGLRAAEEALAPARGLLTLKAQVRFNPMNTYVDAPPYALATGLLVGNVQLRNLDTQLTPQFSVPFKTRDGRTLSSFLGANLEATIPSDAIGQTTQAIAVTLNGKEVARTTVDFARID